MSLQSQYFVLSPLFLALVGAVGVSAQDTTRGDELVSRYFQIETEKLTNRTFADIRTLDDWTKRRGEYRSQLFEMLGLDPIPVKTPLNPVVVGTVEEDEFVVERLHFQSRPGLYVTGNLYRPKTHSVPLPAILYVCGHGRSKTDGISNGNKAHYQHHGAWFARNGYVCLTIDTIQLGEIEGIHHGTYREKMWWWNNRGYSSAGAEAWNCIRALDYLETRKEVDADRMGVTGRSGGGAYSWWVAALDERIKAAVPVAGITSLKNHVVDGCVEGHCDCMYMVNTYRWDYPLVAALVAPRPLLISNTDKDRIFPLDGVVDVHARVRKIYSLYEATDRLGLHITEGPHKDTQELRVHAFRWLNRWLKNDDALIESVATKYFEPQQLRVLDKIPDDQIVTTAHETFVPMAKQDFPKTESELEAAAKDWMNGLNNRVFRGWPNADETPALNVKKVSESTDVLTVRKYEFTSQEPYRLSFYVTQKKGVDHPRKLRIFVANERQWKQSGMKPNETWAFFSPRGVGQTQWSTDERKRTQIRRRFMQLGQTAATMQIWDVRRLLQAIDSMDEFQGWQRELVGQEEASVWALYASLYEPNVSRLELTNLPSRNRDAPDLLNVSRFVHLPQVLMMASKKVKSVHLSGNLDGWAELRNHPLVADLIK